MLANKSSLMYKITQFDNIKLVLWKLESVIFTTVSLLNRSEPVKLEKLRFVEICFPSTAI